MAALNLVAWAGGTGRAPLTIAITDIVGSTPMRERIGDEAMDSVLDAHSRRSRMLIAEHAGHPVKWLGDGDMSVFRTADKGLDYLLALQADPGHPALRIRGIVHVGSVCIRKDDVDGRHVNIASRIGSANTGAEIWVSDQAMEDLNGLRATRHSHLEWRRHAEVKLRGFDNTFTLWSLSPRALLV